MKFFIQPAARADILRQYRYYIELDLPDVADRFYIAVEGAIRAVLAAPGAGAPKQLANPQLAGLRTWPVKGFAARRIYFLVRADVLIIVRVLHGRRDIGAILDDEVTELRQE